MDNTGKSIIFPLSLTTGGKPLVITGPELIRSDIENLLAWEFSSRYFLREFGWKARKLIDEPNDKITKAIILDYLYFAIATWEKRVAINHDKSKVVQTMDGISVELWYTILSTQKEDSFIFPFYKFIKY